MDIYICISEVGGVRALRPQPGNRFVLFVRASGRARSKGCSLDESTEGSSVTVPLWARRCLAVLARVFDFLPFIL